jgi:hypothetical protein
MLRNASLRRTNAELNVFELWIAIAAIVGSLFYFIDPDALLSASVSKEIGSQALAFLWNAGYLASGLGLLYGLLKPSPRIELVGLWLVAATTAINGVAILTAFGNKGAATTVTYFTLSIASLVRARVLYRTARDLADAS